MLDLNLLSTKESGLGHKLLDSQLAQTFASTCYQQRRLNSLLYGEFHMSTGWTDSFLT